MTTNSTDKGIISSLMSTPYKPIHFSGGGSGFNGTTYLLKVRNVFKYLAESVPM